MGGASNPFAGADAEAARRAANENYFGGLGATNASRPADLPPSQGGRYQGFGSAPLEPAGGSGAGLNLDAIRDDPLKALQGGLGWFASTIGSGAQVVSQRVNDPGKLRAVAFQRRALGTHPFSWPSTEFQRGVSTTLGGWWSAANTAANSAWSAAQQARAGMGPSGAGTTGNGGAGDLTGYGHAGAGGGYASMGGYGAPGDGAPDSASSLDPDYSSYLGQPAPHVSPSKTVSVPIPPTPNGAGIGATTAGGQPEEQHDIWQKPVESLGQASSARMGASGRPAMGSRRKVSGAKKDDWDEDSGWSKDW